MGFYGSVFFKSWLVVAQNVIAPDRPNQPKVSLIVQAADAESACEKVRKYLTEEGFTYGPVAAFYG